MKESTMKTTDGTNTGKLPYQCPQIDVMAIGYDDDMLLPTSWYDGQGGPKEGIIEGDPNGSVDDDNYGKGAKEYNIIATDLWGNEEEKEE